MAVVTRSAQRPLVAVFDGDCGMCRRLVEFWSSRAGEAVEFVAAADLGDRLPQLDRKRLEESLHTVSPDGTVHSGAAATCRILERVPGWRWTSWIYRWVPGLAPASELAYRLVARNRSRISPLVRLLAGPDTAAPSWVLSRRVFFFLLGLVHLVAFLSYWVQAGVLVGSEGLLPLDRIFADARDQQLGFFDFPTLLWLWPADAALDLAGVLGSLAAVMLAAGRAVRPCLLVLYALYLSLVNANGVFLAHALDVLLLEASVLAFLLAPPGVRPRWNAAPSTLARLLLLWLLFRLLFLNGIEHLSGAWEGPASVRDYLWTQPLPTVLGLRAVHLPESVHYAAGLVALFVELPLALCIFGFRRMRLWIFLGVVLMQISLLLAGNHGFLELLVVALAVLLLDDQTLARLLPKRLRCTHGLHRPLPWSWRSWCTLTAGSVLFLASLLQVFTAPGEQPSAVLRNVNRWGLANEYRSLAAVWSERPELIVQASDNRESWHPYAMYWKPGAADREPGFAFLHLPRVPHQAAFAARAAASGGEPPLWVSHLAVRLLQSVGPVPDLFAERPFGETAPRYVRWVLYHYHPSSAKEQRRWIWWDRELLGPVTRPFSLGG